MESSKGSLDLYPILTQPLLITANKVGLKPEYLNE